MESPSHDANQTAEQPNRCNADVETRVPLGLSPEQLLSGLAHLNQEWGGHPDRLKYFEAIHRVALQGMGIGLAESEATELRALSYAAERIASRGKCEQPVVFDVGANVGKYTALALSVFANPRLFCFEPSHTAFSVLQQRFGSPERGSISMHRLALSDSHGQACLHANHAGSGLASLYKRDLRFAGIPFEFSEPVKATTLDIFCDVFNIDKIQYLKLDVEGAELSVLSGARRLLQSRRIEFIQFEFGGTDIDSRTFFRDFWNILQGYNIYRMMSKGLGLIESYHEGREIFGYQNYFAELRN